MEIFSVTVDRISEIQDRYFSILRDVRKKDSVYKFIEEIGDEKVRTTIQRIFESYKRAGIGKDINYRIIPCFMTAFALFLEGFEKYFNDDKEQIYAGEKLIGFIKSNYFELIGDLACLTSQTIAEQQRIVTQLEEDVRIKTVESKKYHEDVRDTFTKSGIHSFAVKYSNIAQNEWCAKSIWLLFSVFLSIVIVAVVVFFSLKLINLSDKTYFNLLYVFAERLPIIAVLFVFLVWVARRYAVAREKEIIYRHLATTLHVFKAFYKTAERDHKSLVLMEAAKTLFPAPMDNSTGDSSDNAQMLDVLKLLMNSSAPKGP